MKKLILLLYYMCRLVPMTYDGVGAADIVDREHDKTLCSDYPCKIYVIIYMVCSSVL